MPSRAKSNKKAAEITRIEGLIGDLEKRLHRLNNSAHSEAAGAGDDINQFVAQALESVMGNMRDRANAVTEQVADRASKATVDAYKRVADEVEHYPLATLAVALDSRRFKFPDSMLDRIEIWPRVFGRGDFSHARLLAPVRRPGHRDA